MKFGTREKLGRPRATVTLAARDGEPITVAVRALHYGAGDEVEALFPLPPQPVKYRMKPGSGHIVRDGNGNPVTYLDKDDPGWIKAALEPSRMRVAFALFHGIDDPSIAWSTARDGQTSKEFYAAIFKEIEASGLTFGEVGRIQTKIEELSYLTNEGILAAMPDFSSLGDVGRPSHGAPPTEAGEPSSTPHGTPASGSTHDGSGGSLSQG